MTGRGEPPIVHDPMDDTAIIWDPYLQSMARRL